MAGVETILLTNDDGVESPALLPLADALDHVGVVRVVVPDGERSWSGKAMTRTSPVRVATTNRRGRTVTTVDGTPADAVQVGCADAWAGPAVDVVVSGINLGHNHGEAFALSSGTLGAAVEGVLRGRRGVAFSTGTVDGDFAEWTRWAWDPAARNDWVRLAEVARDVLADLAATDVLDTCELVSVNLPWEAELTTTRRVTRVARTRYGSMLASPLPDGGTAEYPTGAWQPTYGGLHVADPPPDPWPTDLQAAMAGQVSITPLRLATEVRVTPEDVARLEDMADARTPGAP